MSILLYIVSRLKLTCEFVVCDKLAIFQNNSPNVLIGTVLLYEPAYRDKTNTIWLLLLTSGNKGIIPHVICCCSSCAYLINTMKKYFAKRFNTNYNMKNKCDGPI